MKNHHEAAGIVINIVLALVILAFIVIGLNKIGIYNLPDDVERLLGTKKEKKNEIVSENIVTDDVVKINYDDNQTDIEVYNLTHENVELLIENIDYNRNYTQKINTFHFVGDSVFSESINISCFEGLYSAVIYDSDGSVVKQVKQLVDGVEIITFLDGEQVTSTVEKGNFDISDECGFEVSAKSFLESGEALGESDYTVSMGEYGLLINFVFENTVDSFSVEEHYTISLDYGVVVSVETYHNSQLVYSMQTSELV